MSELILKTLKQKEIVDITDKLCQDLSGDGLLNIFITHTTAAISISDLDQGTDSDLLNGVLNITPQLNWNHPHDPTHFPDHLWSTLIGGSLTVPFRGGKFSLGKWQRIILIELDGPRERKLVLTEIK
jgi:secondary thiamine-phosphate synthase enzyme